MTSWEPVIGLEIHVQLDTRTKMFCGCELSFGEPPNTRTCPVCLGLPGTLPVVNAQAVHFALMMGLALGCEIAPRSIFHRKNYFYPDQAKNYQISQYDIPICGGGRLGDVRLHRIHLEEDAAKLVHIGESGRDPRLRRLDRRLQPRRHAAVRDRHRAGHPLGRAGARLAQPAARHAAPARRERREHGGGVAALRRQRLRAPGGQTELGTKTELKNMNSFRFLERGVNAEIERQIALLEAGEPVVQETLHFDPSTGRLSLAALQGGGARLPLLPRAGPRAARADRGDARRRARRAARAARRARRALRAATGGWPRTRPACSPTSRSGATTSSASSTAGGDARRARGRELDGAAARADRRGGRPGRVERHAAGARAT